MDEDHEVINIQYRPNWITGKLGAKNTGLFETGRF